MKISIKELSNNYLNTEGAVVVFAINIEGGYEFQKPALEFNKKTNGALLMPQIYLNFKESMAKWSNCLRRTVLLQVELFYLD